MISCGATNSYGHPDADTVTRLLDGGSIVIVTEKGNSVIFNL